MCRCNEVYLVLLGFSKVPSRVPLFVLIGFLAYYWARLVVNIVAVVESDSVLLASMLFDRVDVDVVQFRGWTVPYLRRMGRFLFQGNRMISLCVSFFFFFKFNRSASFLMALICSWQRHLGSFVIRDFFSFSFFFGPRFDWISSVPHSADCLFLMECN